jgi:hypothetical protein
MTADAIQSVVDRYNSRFDNMDEIAMPQVLAEPKFIQLLEKAIERGSAVTEAELRSAFPGEDWETVEA